MNLRAAAAAAALVATTLTAPMPLIFAPLATATPASQCQEDQPCWDCRTMGNLICGQFDDSTGSDPRDDVATGPNATDLGAYVGGWN